MGLSVHERFKYPSIQGDARSPVFAEIDGLRNFFAATFVSDGLGQAQLERGINAMAATGAKSDGRRPAILIRSSLRKAGTSSTPWHDSYDSFNVSHYSSINDYFCAWTYTLKF